MTLLLTFYYISYNFFIILNDQTVWWFPAINIVLYIPMYIASSFFVVFFMKDELSSRGKLPTAGILILISLFTVALWTTCYYVWLYKRENVYLGFGIAEEKYIQYNKKYYVFKVLLETVILAAFYAYVICVTSTYKGALRT